MRSPDIPPAIQPNATSQRARSASAASVLIVSIATLIAIAALASCQSQRDQARGTSAQPASRSIDPDSVGFVPECNRGVEGLTCYLDTTYTWTFPDEPNPVAAKNWIVFGAAGDSIEIFSGAGSSILTSLGQEHRHGNTAEYFRSRLTNSGAIHVWVYTSEGRGDSVEYWFRLREEGPDGSAPLRVTGERARLTIEGCRPLACASVVPLAMASSVTDLAAWQLDPGTYNVALVRDSLYQVCGVPCDKRDTLKLTSATRATWRAAGNQSRR
jgi:hypothetical protein